MSAENSLCNSHNWKKKMDPQGRWSKWRKAINLYVWNAHLKAFGKVYPTFPGVRNFESGHSNSLG